MDNLTHTLTAVALSHAGLRRKTRYATLALVIGANLPDIDLVTRLAGSATYLKYHRGITHSLLGATAMAAILAATLYQVGRKTPPKKSDPPLDGRWLLGVCAIALGSHLLLDFTNAYGVRPFLPLSGRWYAWDIMFIFDPLLVFLLAVGLGFPMILRLVSEEVGALKPDLRRGAIFSLLCLVLLCGLRDFAHRRALNMLDAHSYRGEDPIRLGAFPSPANPFTWVGVVETESAFYILEAHTLADDVDLDSARVHYKAEPSPALSAAMKTRTATIFAGFARFLWASVQETDDAFHISLRDLRLFFASSPHPGFVVDITVDKNLHVQSEKFSFTGSTQESGD